MTKQRLKWALVAHCMSRMASFPSISLSHHSVRRPSSFIYFPQLKRNKIVEVWGAEVPFEREAEARRRREDKKRRRKDKTRKETEKDRQNGRMSALGQSGRVLPRTNGGTAEENPPLTNLFRTVLGRLGKFLGRLGAPWGALGVPCGALEVPWGHFRVPVERLKAHLGGSWGFLGAPSWP